ncbi:pentapeptide repeat-containing protein [Neisseria mucosa]|uniref:Pentapeptide repeat-containing protein n=1 Tax=Neisseria mucosa TaxID=488 RepID=A0ABN4YB01_NEIMU|nr:pentapeptide repeat-containing protein [Neisseria mucosa]ARC51099.1 pentapeptide repeat-containing protein [Neisseria mucosa]AVR78327.1 pentapeptide repeat-containing protein [Neisseria mucosa]
MGNVASTCDQVVAFVIAYKWAIISILVVLVILSWVCFGKKWSNVLKVFCAGTFSIVIFDILFNWFEFYSKDSIDTLSAGFWNFIILIVSAPVAFAIWHFRDENNKQQIENQRKDINLKEFQKLSEWVSGAHLPEIKTVSKTTNKYNLKNDAEIVRQSTLPIEYTTEETEEYSKQPKTADFDTFSKRDGAVALQISAIYNLLPFFRGDYGESFRRPAFNLLKSAWQAMQQDSLKKLDETHLADEERKKIFDELTQKAKSPMGVALTQVLLSLNRENKKLNLRDFPEMLPNICLAGMNFHLSGLSEISRDLSDLNLNGVDFRGARLNKVKFRKCELLRTRWQKAELSCVDLQHSQLDGVCLQNANLKRANLRHAKLAEVNLQGAELGEANLKKADLVDANLRKAKLVKANLQEANLSTADLQDTQLGGAEFQKAILVGTQLENAQLLGTNLQGTNLEFANLQNAFLKSANLKECQVKWSQLKNDVVLSSAKITEHDFIENIYPDWKKENVPKWAELTNEEKTKAMQQFCDETRILIFDNNGKRQIMPPL